MADRILTTHVGSLPRPDDVADLLTRRAADEIVDAAEFERAVAAGVDDVLARQRAAGIDIPSDGEMSKVGYATYVAERYTGFSGDSPRRVPQDLAEHPRYSARLVGAGRTPSFRRPCCTGEIRLRSAAPLEADIARFKRGLAAHGYATGFLNAAAPGIIALFQPNQHYPSHDAYLEALATAMRTEFLAIAAAGLDLQVDSPDLALGRHVMFPELSDQEFVKLIGAHVEVLNTALAGIPQSRIRLHLCWGNYEGPHTRDIALAQILPTVLGIRFGALSFEAANPRHAHEWAVFRDIKLPEDRVLIPGMLDSTTNFVEHPDLIAERIRTFAGVVGRDRVIAGSDCGFATFAGYGLVDPDIVWLKLAALTEGAARASRTLWGAGA